MVIKCEKRESLQSKGNNTETQRTLREEVFVDKSPASRLKDGLAFFGSHSRC
jgi:hypothetical protein